MKISNRFIKRYVVVPATASLIAMCIIAAVETVNGDPLIASDGLVEIVDGRHVQTLTRRLPLEPGSTLEILNANGGIRVTGWDRDEVLVTAEKRLERRVGLDGWIRGKLNLGIGPSESVSEYFEQTDVVLTRNENGVEIETVYPKWKPEATVSVHFDVKIPVEAYLKLKTSNGPVSVTSIEGAVEVATTNGNITVEKITGPVSARTSNGAVICKEIFGPLAAHSNNGAISVVLPAKASFDLVAKTTNGAIDTAFDVDTQDAATNRRRLAGRVGSGGPKIELSTSNGSISLAKI